MPQKTIITTVAVGVPDPASPKFTPTVMLIAPGTPVTLDADEADRILARWGGEVVATVADDPAATDQAKTRK